MTRRRHTKARTGPPYLTPAQVAARWGWHVESVRRWARARKLARTRVSRRVLIPLATIEAIEAQGRLYH